MVNPACNRDRTGRGLLQAVAVVCAVLVASEVHAIHRVTPFLVNLSNDPGGYSVNPGVRGQPSRTAFESPSDLKHNGSTGQQIFYYALAPVSKDARTLNQVTNFPGDSANSTGDGIGNLMAFDSAADILGTGSMARQIFLWDRNVNAFIQLTRGLADSTKPMLDLKGDAIVFESQADLKGGSGLPLAAKQIFVYDMPNGPPPCDLRGCYPDPNRLTQVTYGTRPSAHPYITIGGQFVLFHTDDAITGPANGFQQVYLFDRLAGGKITQITNGAGDSINASVDDEGRMVVFQSRADLLGNGSTGWQIFMLDRQRNVLRQLTNGAGFSTQPSIGDADEYVSFVSTSDLLSTGATGQHLFFYDPRTDRMFQVTKVPGTTSDHPVTAGGFFIVFDTDEDIMNKGMTGRQVYSLDTYGRVPPPLIGKRQVGLAGGGQFLITFGSRDGRAEAPLTMPGDGVTFPPIPVPGFGTACLKAAGDGKGFVACIGGRPGGNLVVTRDHNASDLDPTCAVAGSCEEGQPCRGPLPSPHVATCPTCVGGTCDSGPNAGQACATDSTCLQNIHCVPGTGACNGPERIASTGNYGRGGVQITLPVTVSLSLDPRLDGKECTADDSYLFKNIPMDLALTTGSAMGAILDANDVAGDTLTAADTGHPFDCKRLEKSNFEGAVLVGLLPFFDIPNQSGGVEDMFVDVRLPALGGKPYTPCTAISCRVLTLCSTDADCNDNNVCNGIETCVNNNCVAGVPPTCDDGDPCNGTETCHPLLGCQPGTALSCDDGAACTQDVCVPTVGCTHTPIPGCCLTNADCIDTNVCNGSEVCVSGNCLSGTPLACDDGNACNGAETCDPTSGCQPGTAPDRFSYLGVRCAIDQIQAAIDATPEQLLGGHPRVVRYNQVLVGVRSSFGYLTPNPNPKRIPGGTKVLPKAALDRLNVLYRALSASIRNGRAYPAYANPIKDLVAEAMLRMRHYRLGVPKP